MEKVFEIIKSIFGEVITSPFYLTIKGNNAKIYLPSHIVIPDTTREYIKKVTFKGAQMVLHV